ncbi:carbohydrate binding family 9 domain-containing protein [Undibacterium sp. FT137W]|uniref:Carbohydrate binding family 9 domain-containing protein n=2 Tax=Undibacterium fentianense TaxID=2828728 RepID=A0A941E128_9BURK|nr:carbohydrate binding family 9 domain-containing protein [Undibacterium fentianense]
MSANSAASSFAALAAATSSVASSSALQLGQGSVNNTIPRAKSAPQLRDYLDTIPRDAGLAITDFRQRNPGDGVPASRPTTAYLSYDDTHFYAVFVAQDEPDQIRAKISKRDNMDGEDFVVLELDTFHDKRRSFSFFVNPYGVQQDSKRTEGQEPDVNFDTQWESEGQITANGYVVRIAIPLKSLRFKSADVQTWGIGVGRVITRLNEESFWPLITKQVAGFVPQLASLQLPEKLSAGRNAQINPFVFMGNSQLLNTENFQRPYWQQDNKVQAGLDAKWVLGDSTAIDLTLKPDFSEVDSDEPQIVVGKRYEVLFPEKRPFFLENASFFTTPSPLFFSRRIHQPQAGVRITGRHEAWAYGGLLIDDQAAGEDGLQGESKATIAMARVQNDLTHDLALGALFTQRQIRPQEQMSGQSALGRDTVMSIDGRYQFDENWIWQAQFARSQTIASRHVSLDSSDGSDRDAAFRQSQLAGRTQGHLMLIEAKHQGRHWEYQGKYLDTSANFATSLAFLPRTDVKQLQQEAKYIWHLDEYEHLQKLGLHANTEITRNQDNQLQDWNVYLGGLAEASRNSWLEIYQRRGFERFAGRDYQKQGWQVNLGTDWLPSLSVMTEFGVMDSINYTPTSNAAASMGRGRSIDLTLVYKPHPQWRLEEKLLWNDLQLPAKLSTGQSVVNAYRNLMWRSKLSYQHNRFLGVRLIADYHVLASDPRWSALESGKQLNTDLQVSYMLSPGTSLIAGYGNRQENLALTGNPSYLQRIEDLSLKTGRRAFVKMNYLYQL